MSYVSFEVRVCQSCGLRYPLTVGHPFGLRCPHCLGETRVVLSRQIQKEAVVDEERSKKKEMKAVLLDNIRSAWNVGSILRSADGFGFSHAYLCGITPTPEVDAVRKTALGADEFVTWSHHKDSVKLVSGLKLEGWKVVALEENEQSVSVARFSEFQFSHPIVMLVGSEVTGVDPELLALADAVFHIPMHGQKRSFNVAVAFGVAGFALSS